LSYSPSIREFAFKIWRQEGTDERTAARLAREYPEGIVRPPAGISAKTIMKWRVEDNWEGRAELESSPPPSRQVEDGERPADLRGLDEKLFRVLEGAVKGFETLFSDQSSASVQARIDAGLKLVKLQQEVRRLRNLANELEPEKLAAAVAKFNQCLDKVPEIKAVLTTSVRGRLAREIEIGFGF